jgi:hypothetical protein
MSAKSYVGVHGDKTIRHIAGEAVVHSADGFPFGFSPLAEASRDGGRSVLAGADLVVVFRCKVEL